MSDESIFGFVRYVLIFVVLFVVLMIGLKLYGDYQIKLNNEKEYGLEVSNEEIKCWKACGEDKYFFSGAGSIFGTAECECGVTSNQQKIKVK